MAFLSAFGAIGRFLVLIAVGLGVIGMVAGGGTRATMWVIALSLGTTGFVFAFIGRRLGTVTGLDSRLRSAGVAGTATVTSVRDLGVRVNGGPVVEMGLDVDVSSHEPYSVAIRQRVPLSHGGLHPGSRVGVVVDPTDRAHLAVDWGADVSEPPSAPPQPVFGEPVPSQMRDAEHLLRVGRRARAIVISMTDAGDMSELGLVEVGTPGDDDRLFIVDMEVQQAGLDPYEIRVAHRVPEHLVGRVGPRTTVTVAVDRDDDRAVAIDWSSLGR